VAGILNASTEDYLFPQQPPRKWTTIHRVFQWVALIDENYRHFIAQRPNKLVNHKVPSKNRQPAHYR
jgi:hypothetical protein